MIAGDKPPCTQNMRLSMSADKLRSMHSNISHKGLKVKCQSLQHTQSLAQLTPDVTLCSQLPLPVAWTSPEIVKNVCAISPDIHRTILPKAFIIEAVYLHCTYMPGESHSSSTCVAEVLQVKQAQQLKMRRSDPYQCRKQLPV